MLRAIQSFVAVIVCSSLLSATGCGQSAETPTAGAKPDAIVTLDGPQHACLVALSSEAQASTVACDDLVAFMRDELRLASGSVYTVRTIPAVDETQLAKVKATLKEAGYRDGGGPH